MMKSLIRLVLSLMMLMPSTAWGEEYTYDSGSLLGWDGNSGMYSCLTIDFQNSTTVCSPDKFSNISKVEIVAGGASQIYSSFAVSVNGSDYQSIVSTTGNGYVIPEYVEYDTYTFTFTPEKEPQHIRISAQYDAMSGTQGWVYVQSVTVYTEDDTEPGGNCDMSEIPTTNAYYAATSFLCERGILDGSKVDGKYMVGEKLLRQHLANITFRGLFTLKGREIPSTFVSDQYPAIYDDLKSDAPYYQAAKTLLYLDYGDGITPFDRDRDGFFPDYNEARINILKELMEAFNIKSDMEGTDNPFPNEPNMAHLSETSPIKMGYVRQAAKLGIITTENEQFRPYDDCTRGEAFLMLARIIQKIEAGEIADPNPLKSDFLDPNSGTGTADPDAEPYAALSNNNTVLTFYYDNQKQARRGMSVGPFTVDFPLSGNQSWADACSSVTSVVFDASFANCTSITSTAGWFFDFRNLKTITGIENLKTDNVKDMSYMFYACFNLTSLDVSSFNTANVTKMVYMFGCCFSLTSLDLSSFNTANVTDIGGMFYSCRGLLSLNLSHFNTKKVTDMRSVFYECSSLTSLDLSSFNTANVTMMGSMFDLCSSLTSLDASSFKTTRVESMPYMFANCDNLTNVDISSFYTPNLKDLRYMFYSCPKLTTIYAGQYWSTAKVTNGNNMFQGCDNLIGGAGTKYNSNRCDYTYAHTDGGTAKPGYFTYKSAPPVTEPEPYALLSDDNTVLTFYYDTQMAERNGMGVWPFSDSNYPSWYGQKKNITSVVFDDSFANCTTLTSTAYWFYDLSNLSSITGISNLKTDNVTNMNSMFMYCYALKSLDVTGFKTDNVKDMGNMFWRCGLTSIDVSGFKTDNVTNMGSMFLGCSGLTSLDVTGFKTDNVTIMANMFNECSGLTDLDVSGFKTDNVKNMFCMFYGCSGLTSLDLTGFKTDNVALIFEMFNGCSGLTTIFVSNDWNTAAVTKGSKMFAGCSKLVGGAGSTYNANHTDYTYARIDGGADNPGYFTLKMRGDLSGDGNVDEADLKLLVNVVMDGDKNNLAVADLNGDGNVDAADVVMLVNIIKSQNK